MELINFPSSHISAPHLLPSVYTPARIESMGRANSVARTLRGLGYRIIAEDPFPDDGGSPIIQIELGAVGVRPLSHLGQCLVNDSSRGVQRTIIDGVRVVWQTVEAS